VQMSPIASESNQVPHTGSIVTAPLRSRLGFPDVSLRKDLIV